VRGSGKDKRLEFEIPSFAYNLGLTQSQLSAPSRLPSLGATVIAENVDEGTTLVTGLATGIDVLGSRSYSEERSLPAVARFYAQVPIAVFIIIDAGMAM
jgi:hypothetical protein